MIELAPPAVFREARPEKFTVAGFTCPECHGNGWGYYSDPDDANADRRGWARKECPVCGGSREVTAEVTVRWHGKEVTA